MDTVKPVRFSQRALSWLIISLLVWQPVAPSFAAAITPNGPATMDKAANGVPVVNIATPNGAGISHNQFKDYNVGTEGVILNNATGQLTQTQLGGLVQNNPNLRAGQEARGIINEVTGGSRSQLQGYTEVAGKAANVMVANPYGITCNGCGFINTPNATLTTGKPQFDAAGNLSALEVTKGTITVEGKGLDASASDALSLISRATEVNAAIHAKALTVTAGANRIDASGNATPIAGEGAAPVVAVDTGALGGMYANRIHLVSTEKGVGVNLGNLAARQGDIQLDANGKMVIRESVASGSLTASGESVTLNGSHQTGGNMVIAGTQAVALNGNQVAKETLEVKAKSLTHSGTSTANRIALTGQDTLTNSGSLVAEELALGASHITNSGKLQGTQALNLNTTQLDNLASGTLYSAQDLTLTLPQLNNQGTVQGRSLNLTGDLLHNSGTLLSESNTQLKIGQLDNQGTIAAKQQLTAETSWLNNGLAGQLQSSGNIRLGADNAVLNGTQQANGALEVTANTLDHTGKSSASALNLNARDTLTNSGSLVANNLTLGAAHIRNSGQVQGSDALNLNTSLLDNQASGTLYSAKDLNFTLPQLNNQGTVQGLSLRITGDVLKNEGTLLADTGLWLKARQLENQGSIAAQGQLTASATELNNRGRLESKGRVDLSADNAMLGGTQTAQDALNVTAKTLNHSGQTSAAAVALTATDAINNSGSLVANNLALHAAQINNSAQIQGTQALNLQADRLENQASGTIYTARDLILNIPQLHNSGTIQGLSLSTTGDVLQNEGTLLADTGLWLRAGQLDNRGNIAAKGPLMANATRLTNAGRLESKSRMDLSADDATLGGTQTAQDALTVTAKTLNHSGQTSAAAVTLTATDGINNSGEMSGAAVALTAKNNINNSGALIADNLALHAAQINNSAQIQGTQALNLQADRLDNQASGTIYTAQDLILNIPQLHNSGTIQGLSLNATSDVLQNEGKLLADTGLALKAQQLENRGNVAAKGPLNASAGRLNNQGMMQGLTLGIAGDVLENSGTLQGKTLDMRGGQVRNSGMLVADDALRIDAGSVTTTADSTLNSKGNLQLSAKRDASLQGQLNADKSLEVEAGTLTSTAQLQSGGKMAIAADSATLNGAQWAKGTLEVKANTLNHGGRTSAGSIALTAQDGLTNSGTLISDSLALNARQIANRGLLQGTQALNLNTGQLDNETGGSIYSVQSLLLNIPHLNNLGTIQALSLAFIGDTLRNDGALTFTSDALLRANTLENRGAITAKGRLTTEGATLDNSGSLEGQTLEIAADTLRNSGSTLSAGDTQLRAGLLDNRATMAAKGQLTADSQTLINSGTLQGQTLDIGGDAIQNSGTLNAAGAAQIRGGEVTNLGAVAAKGQLAASVTALNNSGTVQGQALDITGDRVQNSGTLASDSALRVQAGTLASGTGSIITGIGNVVLRAQTGADLDGQVNAGGALTVHAGTLSSQQQAQLQSEGNMTLEADNVTLNGTQAVKGALDVKANSLSHGGKSSATGINLNGQTTLSNSGTLVADNLAMNGGKIRNSGLLQGTRVLALQAGKLDNLSGGTIYSTQGFTLATPELTNSGLITTDGELHIGGNTLVNDGEINGVSLSSDYRNLTNAASGRLLADKNLTFNSANIVNDGLVSADTGSVTAQSLENRGELTATSLLLTLTRQAINHNNGRIIGESGLTLSAPTLLNQGLMAGNSLTLKQGDITNSGTLQGTNGLSATGASLNNEQGGVVLSNGAVTVKNGRLVNAGQLQGDTLDLATGEWLNSGTALGKNGLNAEVSGKMDNQGRIISQQALTLRAAGSENDGTLMAKVFALHGDVRNSGLIQGSDTLAWDGTSLVNAASGQMLSGNGLTLNGSTLDNQGQLQGRTVTANADSLHNDGTLQAQDDLNATLSGKLDNQGQMLSQGAADIRTAQTQNGGKLAAKVLRLTAPELTNTGLLQGNDALTLSTLNLLNGSKGQLVSGNALALNLDRLENQGQLYVNGGLTLNALTLVNGGSVESDALDATLRGILTNSGTLLAHQDAVLRGDTQTNSGDIAAQSLTLEGRALSNSGLMQGTHGLQATADTLLNKAGGRLLSGDAMTLNAGKLENGGTVQGAAVSLNGSSLNNRGLVNGLQGLTGVYGADVTNDGQLVSGGATDLRAQTLTNIGRITGNTLTLSGPELHNNGLWQGNNGLTVSGDTLTTGAGSRTLSGGALTLDGGSLTTLGTLQGSQVNVAADNWTLGGSLLSQGELTANVGNTLALSGSLTSQGGMNVRAQTLNNDGQMLSAGDITLSGQSLTNTGMLQGNSLAAHESRITNTGKLIGLKGLQLDNRQPAVTTLARMALVAPALELSNGATGSLLTQGTLDITAGTVRNAGNWQGNRVILAAQSLENGGAVQSAGALNLTLTGNLNSTAGSKITAMGAAALQALSLTNQGQWAAATLTLKGNTLDNSGAISGRDSATATLNGAFTQQARGTFASNGTLGLTAATVGNQGKIQGGDLTLTASSLTNNAGAELVSARGLTLTAPSLFNYGLIQGAGETRIESTAQAINAGKLLSGARLTLTTPQYSGAGWLQATNLILNAANNAGTGTLLADQMTLTGNTFTNQGTTQANNLALNYAQLTNNGTLLGNSQLTVNASQVNQSASGKLFSGGDLFVGATGMNTLGQVVALGNLTLQLADAFTGKTALAAGRNLNISSNGAIDNQSVMQGQAVNLSAGGQLTNNGQITTGNGSSTLSGSTIVLNGNGSLQGGGDVTLSSRGAIAVNGFTGTRGSLTLSAPGSIINTALLYAANNLALYANSITNQRGDMLAGNNLSMQRDAAGNANSEVVNTSGNIETQNGDITIRTGKLLNEREGISESRSYQAAAGSPAASGANSIVLKVRDLPPDEWGYIFEMVGGFGGAGVVAEVAPMAKGSVQRYLVGSTVVNVTAKGGASRISASRNLNINAAMLNNQASNLMAGNEINLSGDTLNNQSYFGYSEDEYRVYRYHGKTARSPSQSSGSVKLKHKNRQVTYTLDGAPQYETHNTDQVFRSVIQAGGRVSANFTNNVSNTATTSNAGGITHTIPAPSLNTLSNQGIGGSVAKQALAAGSASVNSPQWQDQLQNALQQINGGGSLDNGTTAGTALSTVSGQQKGSASLGNAGSLASANVTQAALKNIANSGPGQHQGKTVDTSAWPLPTGNNGYFVVSANPKSPYLITLNPKLDGLGDLDPALFGDLNVLLGLSPSASAPGYNAANLPTGVNPAAKPTGQNSSGLPGGITPVSQVNGPSLPQGMTPSEGVKLVSAPGGITGAGVSTPDLAGNPLFVQAGMTTLVAPRETNPKYTDEKLFLGSAYMLDRINLKPDYDYRFLGDAAFDTRYVSNAMLNQTGNRYLNGIGSDLEQMRYLMDNAANAKQSLGLQFGIALTADQIAALDHSILWWERATIGGETVMIPKLYLSPKDVTVNNGSVIAGNNVTINGGKVTNSGSTLLARNDLSVNSASQIINTNDALLKAGGNVDLSAVGDINNISSAISGKTVALESLDGSINNITLADQFALNAQGKGGTISLKDTTLGSIASITALDGLSLTAGKDITLTGSTLAAGGDLLIDAGGNIAVNAIEINDAHGQSGFRRQAPTSRSTVNYQGSGITAGGSLSMQAGEDLTLTASDVRAGKDASLAAGNDLNLNAQQTSQNSRNGNSENHSTGLDRTTVSAGGNLFLTAGQDIHSQAAGLAAEQQVGMQAGRDVDLQAAETTQGDSYKARKKTVINEQVRQQGTEIASGAGTTIIAGRDMNAEAAQVTAQGDIGVQAGRDINLTTATESDYHYQEQTKTKKGFLKKTTTHTISEQSATRESGTLLSGDNITLKSGNDLLVKGSNVVGDGNVALSAGHDVNIEAATNTDSNWQFKEKKKSGLMGSGGIGFTIGTSKTTQDLKEKGTTQSQSMSAIGSNGGNVAINAGEQLHVGGADLVAKKDLSLSGDSVVVEPGRDKRVSDQTFKQKSSGLTVALSGAVGDAINTAATTAMEAKDQSDGRLAALQATKAALSGIQAGQASRLADAASGGDMTKNGAFGVMASIGGQSSKSTSHSEQETNTGSTLNAGNDLSITASGKGQAANSGDIAIAGSQLKAGKDLTLDAARDITLTGAADTQKTTGSNSSKGGSLGVGITAGKDGAGFTVSASGNAAKGGEKGNGTTWKESTLDAGQNVSLSSGRDTLLQGAQVNGDKVTADVGRDLTLSSLQDSDTYNSKQQSVSGGLNYTFGSGAGGSFSYSRDKMKSNYDSVQEQTGIFAGKGGFDVTVGNHTQLDGAVLASRAEADKNRLDTGTLGFTDIANKADYKVEHVGGGFSTGGSIAGNVIGNMASNMLTGLGGSGHAEGTTQSAVADGTVIVRDSANQQQDVSTLSRDTEHANGSIDPIFNKEKEQRRLQTAQLIGEIGSQVSDVVRTDAKITATENAKASMQHADEKDRAAAISLLQKAGKPVTDEAISDQMYQTFYNREFAKTQQGTGGSVQRAITATTAAVQALAGGDLKSAIAGGAAPYLANEIARLIPETDWQARVLAHAVVNAALAAASKKDAATAAAGAATGELAGIIAVDAYHKTVGELSEEEKQTVSALATLASGLAGGLVGDSSASVVAAAQAGKTTVENNYLSDDFTCKSGDTSCNQRKALVNKLIANGAPDIAEILEAAKNCPGGKGPCTSAAEKYNHDKEKFISVVDSMVKKGQLNRDELATINYELWQSMSQSEEIRKSPLWIHYAEMSYWSNGPVDKVIDTSLIEYEAHNAGLSPTQTREAVESYRQETMWATIIGIALADGGRGGKIPGGKGKYEPGLKFETTMPVVVTGQRAIDKAQSYESTIRSQYGNTSYNNRKYEALVNGKVVNGVADEVALIGGKVTAIEAKFVDNWSTSIRNPDSPGGSKPWAIAEQKKMVEQAKKYSAGFEGGARYHTNSPELASHYTKVFNEAGVTNFKFVVTPTTQKER
ncbi:hemagglutinin repeat-containing protein [Kosakonia cowanii]|uniref:hemagglutinin repeat-containing protein n=1 Tax=Kosakonia cowanii TaxID=208223 RepID=UPI0023F6AAEA|nr:hemagglutinin repeat-containing protein [Kosakonia cowanii]MDF7758528.1 hemagglutinin repeat-containing protein [Kosakonia cowanii]